MSTDFDRFAQDVWDELRITTISGDFDNDTHEKYMNWVRSEKGQIVIRASKNPYDALREEIVRITGIKTKPNVKRTRTA